jgi:hypothetical protein
MELTVARLARVLGPLFDVLAEVDRFAVLLHNCFLVVRWALGRA